MSAQVEHFRPKGRVVEDSSHKGYWWLASTWTNLLPSCSHCNISEYHEIHKLTVEQPYQQKTQSGKYKLGKYDHFPIGGQRAVAEGDDLDLEDAYLIDPTRRNPNDHLDWIVEGGLSLIAPNRVGNAWDPYGLHTYQIFGLNRKKLVETRTSLMLEVTNQLLKARNKLMDAATKKPGELFDYLYNDAMDIFKDLDKLKAPSMPYSAMVKKFWTKSAPRLWQRSRLSPGDHKPLVRVCKNRLSVYRRQAKSYNDWRTQFRTEHRAATVGGRQQRPVLPNIECRATCTTLL